MTPDQVAEALGVATGTLAKWRMTGLDGPRFLKFGSKVRYDVADVETWIETRRRRSTSDSGRAA
jgi:excisionase family DNA binding protein